jgi:hypothetical protein
MLPPTTDWAERALADAEWIEDDQDRGTTTL